MDMAPPSPTDLRDAGFTLVELLIVIVIVGVLATVGALSLRGMAAGSTDAVCATDKLILTTAIDYYEADHGTVVPGDTPAERLDALVDAGLIVSPSSTYAIEADGTVTGTGTCTGDGR